MAKKTDRTKEESNAKITKIKANDTTPKSEKQKSLKSSTSASTPKKDAKKSKGEKQTKSRNPFAPIGRYFKGSWFELKQVRWPTRRATWGFTFAVLAYTALFVAFIVVLDLGFNKLLELIIG